MIFLFKYLRTEGNFFNLIKNIYTEPTVTIIFNGEKFSSSRIANKRILRNKRLFLSPFLFTIIMEVLANAIKERKYID